MRHLRLLPVVGLFAGSTLAAPAAEPDVSSASRKIYLPENLRPYRPFPGKIRPPPSFHYYYSGKEEDDCDEVDHHTARYKPKIKPKIKQTHPKYRTKTVKQIAKTIYAPVDISPSTTTVTAHSGADAYANPFGARPTQPCITC